MRTIIKALRYLLPLLSIHSFFQTLFFNFYYLPIRQAIFLPIWIYKPHFIRLKGKIKIESTTLKPGMIRLGFLGGRMYPNNGIQWTHEGIVTFKGTCRIGNNSFIVTGKQGNIIFENDFMATASAKIISFIGIKFGISTRLGWEGLVMDTNFHPLYDMEKDKFKKAYGSIHIGDFNWFGNQCLIMHSVTTPERCIFGGRSVITRGGKYESYCVHGGSPIRVLSRNVMRVIGKDKIDEYKLD